MPTVTVMDTSMFCYSIL